MYSQGDSYSEKLEFLNFWFNFKWFTDVTLCTVERWFLLRKVWFLKNDLNLFADVTLCTVRWFLPRWLLFKKFNIWRILQMLPSCKISIGEINFLCNGQYSMKNWLNPFCKEITMFIMSLHSESFTPIGRYKIINYKTEKRKILGKIELLMGKLLRIN